MSCIPPPPFWFLVREQAWIRELHAGFPHGYNIEVHFPNEKTQERYQQRKHSGKPKKKRSHNGWRVIPDRGIPVPDPLRTEPDYTFNPNTGVLSFSTEAGHSASICRDLARLVQTDDDPVERNELLDTLSRSKMRRLQNWLTVNQPPEDCTVQNLFQQLILALDSHRKNDASHQSHGIFQSYDSTAPAEQEKKQKKKTDANAVQWLKIPWRRNEMQQISIHTLINDPEIKEAYPLKGDDEVVKISYSLAVPNGVWLQNYGKVCQEVDLDAPVAPAVPEPLNCPCWRFRTDSTIDFHGHVATTDPGSITDERLRSYWLKGRKFRIQADPGVLESSIEANVDAFIHRASKRKCMDKQAFEAWKSKLLTAVRVKMNQIFREDTDISHHTFLSKKGLEELSALQEHMVVTYAGKSAHDFVTCCKHVYKKLLWTELHSPHYENTSKTSAEIDSKHQSLSTQVGRPAVQAHRYLYGILKMHKATVGMRWIAGNHMQAIEGPMLLKGPQANRCTHKAEHTKGGLWPPQESCY